MCVAFDHLLADLDEAEHLGQGLGLLGELEAHLGVLFLPQGGADEMLFHERDHLRFCGAQTTNDHPSQEFNLRFTHNPTNASAHGVASQVQGAKQTGGENTMKLQTNCCTTCIDSSHRAALPPRALRPRGTTLRSVTQQTQNTVPDRTATNNIPGMLHTKHNKNASFIQLFWLLPSSTSSPSRSRSRSP